MQTLVRMEVNKETFGKMSLNGGVFSALSLDANIMTSDHWVLEVVQYLCGTYGYCEASGINNSNAACRTKQLYSHGKQIKWPHGYHEASVSLISSQHVVGSSSSTMANK